MADGNLKLAVLGLGTMGQAMTSSALRTGSRPSYGIATSRGSSLRRTRSRSRRRHAAAVKSADVYITMVTDAKAVMSIALDLGMLGALPSGAVWAQMSTIGVEATEEIDSIVKERSARTSHSSTRRSRAARYLPNKDGSQSLHPGPSGASQGRDRFSPRSESGPSGSERRGGSR